MLKRYKKSTLRIRKETMLGFSSMALLLLIALALICPLAQDNSYATCADGTGGEGENCTSSMAEIDTEVNVSTSISIAVDSRMGLDLTPSSNGATSTTSGKVLVATNSIDGYALFMKASNGLTNTSTVNSATSTEAGSSVVNAISNLSTNSTLANMPMNTYGYNLSNTLPSEVDATTSTYLPLDTTGSNAIRRTSFSTGSSGSTSSSNTSADTDYGYGDSFYLNLGVKVGNSLPAGTYAGTITLSAVANPLTVKSMAGLTYMQDMTSEICANTREHYTKQLVDVRDGNSYWVAKLKDGNCWMTQNLALNLTGTGLKADDTDIDTDWDSSSANPPTDTVIVTEPGKEGNYVASYALENRVLAIPEQALPCTTFECPEGGTVLIDDEWQPTYTAQVGSFTLPDGTTYNNTLVTVDQNAKTYDAHYLFGNYYSPLAAIAGANDNAAKNVDAAGTICPKNWTLPVARTDENLRPIAANGSYYSLLQSYGYPESQNYHFTAGNGSYWTYYNQRSSITFGSPIHMVRIGTPNITTYGNTFSELYTKTFTEKTDKGARLYLANFNTNQVAPVYTKPTNYGGRTMRCLAR